MDWEKAKRRSLASTPQPGRRKPNDTCQKAMAEFVVKHDFVCFKCGSRDRQWAKTGANKRRPVGDLR
jgi:hypothetical protein